MDDHNYLLLSNNTNDEAKKSNILLLSLVVKWVMKVIMWVCFSFWVAIIFIYPLESAEVWIQTWTDATSGSFLGFTGSCFVLFSGPIIAISVLSILYLALDSHQHQHQERSRKIKKGGYKLWTFPIVVGGPLGVISAAELIGILAFGLFVIWVASVYAVQKLSVLFANPDYTTTVRWSWFFRMSGRGCGLTGLFCLSFMFIPVARGSSILRLLNVSPLHAIRYHIWLAHLCLCLFTSHGFLYLIGWFMSGEIPSELISWTPTEGANLAGIINIFFGWTIWITSLPFVRKKNFELFYYTHHLYIIFIIFLAMHVGNFFFCIVAGAIFLFTIDRFLRFCQSRHTVGVISTTSFPCGVVQLVMSRPQSLNHNALSSIFLQIKELSLLQWHPFSVSSSCLDGKNQLSVMIKACGNWTSQLEDHTLNLKVAKELRLHNGSTSLTASVEGPYGSEFSSHLMYEHLVLVGGGIGITPFIAVLSDIINRIKLGEESLARNISLVWAVKTSKELSLLSTIDIKSLHSHELHLQILIYVTQETQPPSYVLVIRPQLVGQLEGLPHGVTGESSIDSIPFQGLLNMNNFFQSNCEIIEEKQGDVELNESMVTCMSGAKQVFEVPLAAVSETQLQGKNDILLQFHVDDKTGATEENVGVEKAIRMCSKGENGSSSGNSISILASTGNKSWFAVYMISSTVGLIVLISIVNLLYVRPYEIINWWLQGLLLVACMVASVSLFGGASIRLWHTSHNKKDSNGVVFIEEELDDEESNLDDTFLNYFGSSTIIQYASRPNFKEIFGSISKLLGDVDVGVIVCGPHSLEKSVAKECRSLNFSRQSDDPIFHFNTHTFTL